jgi:energy-coupling factor transport system substrate-specific component
MKLLDSIKKDFNTLTWVLIPVAIVINIVIGQIVSLLKLPVYLDSIGTVLVGVICGPWAGALTGALANTIWGITIDPNALPWWPVALFIGFVAGWCARYGLFKNTWKVLITGFLVALTAAIVSSFVNVIVYGGITASGSSLITAYLLQQGRDLITSVISTNFLVEPVDKISTALLAFVILRGLSVRYLARFPRPENAAIEPDDRRSLFLGVAVFVVYIILAASFFNLTFLWIGLIVTAILLAAILLISRPSASAQRK